MAAYAAGDGATFDVVPQDQRFTSLTRLAEVERVAVRLLTELGSPSPIDGISTPADVYALAMAYFREARALKTAVVALTVSQALHSIIAETVAGNKLNLCALDPMRSVGGQFVISGSPGDLVSGCAPIK